MIARITLDGGDELTLGDDLTWTGTDPTRAAALNVSLLTEDRSPARGDWLAAHVERTAELLGGTAAFGPAESPPSGRIY